MSCFGLRLACRPQQDWIGFTLLNDVTQSQYEREIARLSAQNQLLEATLVRNDITGTINAIRLDRFLREHVLPRLRTREDALWVHGQLEEGEPLYLLISFQHRLLSPSTARSLAPPRQRITSDARKQLKLSQTTSPCLGRSLKATTQHCGSSCHKMACPF